MSTSPPDRARHNLAQRRYFERTVKATMVPVRSPYLLRHVDELLRFAGYRAGERVLEVGCGMGRYTLLLAERGVAVEGLDLSPVLFDRLASYNAGRFAIPLYCADLEETPPALQARFDPVAGFFVLHHLRDLGRAFAAMAGLLAPGGRAVVPRAQPVRPAVLRQILVTPGMSWEGDGGLIRMRRRVVSEAMHADGLVGFRTSRFGFFPPSLANRRWGSRLERVLERIPPLGPVFPFQLFLALKPAGCGPTVSLPGWSRPTQGPPGAIRDPRRASHRRDRAQAPGSVRPTRPAC